MNYDCFKLNYAKKCKITVAVIPVIYWMFAKDYIKVSYFCYIQFLQQIYQQSIFFNIAFGWRFIFASICSAPLKMQITCETSGRQSFPQRQTTSEKRTPDSNTGV